MEMQKGKASTSTKSAVHREKPKKPDKKQKFQWKAYERFRRRKMGDPIMMHIYILPHPDSIYGTLPDSLPHAA